VFRVGQHCRRVGNISGCAGGRAEELATERQRSVAGKRLLVFVHRSVCARSFLFGSVLDAERRWPGAVREGGAVLPDYGRCVRRRQQVVIFLAARVKLKQLAN